MPGAAALGDSLMQLVREPALFAFLFLRKQSAELDTARQVFKELEAFSREFELKTDRSDLPFGSVGAIDWNSLSDLAVDYLLLFRAGAAYPAATKAKGYSELLIYCYHDAVIIQLQLSRLKDWSGSLEAGWQELSSDFHRSFKLESHTRVSGSLILGASTVYWVFADDKAKCCDYQDEVTKLNAALPRRSSTDIGLLWFSEDCVFYDGKLQENRWTLVTPSSSQTEAAWRYYRTRAQSISPFAQLALARHKIFFEIGQYRESRRGMEHQAQTLQSEATQFLETQRRLDCELNELLSKQAIRFQTDLARATNGLAAYHNHIGRLRELRKTIEVNARIYLLNAIALLSREKREQVLRSRMRYRAAERLLDVHSEDGIFGGDLGAIEQHQHQLITDIEYAQSLIDRHSASLRSGADQLRIAGEREIAEIAKHMAVDSAAVVASIAAIVVVELAIKPHQDKMEGIAGYHNSLEGWLLVTAVVMGTYGLTQVLGNKSRIAPGQRPLIIACAAVFAWVATALLNHPGFSFEQLRDGHGFFYAVPAIVFAALFGAILGSKAQEFWRTGFRRMHPNPAPLDSSQGELETEQASLTSSGSTSFSLIANNPPEK